MKQTVALIILDGWGIGSASETNPIHVAAPERFKWLEDNFPVTSLQASGINVGLPWGEVGNSEVGHLSLGAGKIIYQYFPKISMAIKDGTFFSNAVLKRAFAHAKERGTGVNFVGLLSNANVHASFDHLQALLRMAEQEGVPNVKLHLFADGKDSGPKSIDRLLLALPKEKLASLIGRYYAMNRNEQWSLTAQTYGCLVGTSGQAVDDPSPAIEAIFRRGMSEEFLPPLRIGQGKQIAAGDAVLFFNYREDSMRQIAAAFIKKDFSEFPRQKPDDLFIATMTPYKRDFDAPAAFMPDMAEMPLAEVLSKNNKSQLRIAETYKYAHVTYFFNGYREEPYAGEYRVLIPSLNLAHPEERPELMAPAITDRLIETIRGQAFDFVLANYSNPDTIAHTGNYQSCLQTVKVIDREIGRVVDAALATSAIVLITSDHGNIEQVLNATTGQTETQHDPNPVPFHLVGKRFEKRKFWNSQNFRTDPLGLLSDVAPTVLELMRIPQPKEMTGKSLLRNLL